MKRRGEKDDLGGQDGRGDLTLKGHRHYFCLVGQRDGETGHRRFKWVNHPILETEEG